MAPSVVYIGGTGRSGSTLLARLVSGVPGVVAVGELRYVLDRGLAQDHLCGCGRSFRSCPFWSDVMRRVLPGGDDAGRALAALSRGVDRNRYIPLLVWPRLRSARFRRRFAEYAAYLEQLYAAIAEVSGASVIVDSSKDPSYAFVLHATPGVDLAILHLVRDSRAVAYSWTRRKERPEVPGEVTHMATRSPLRAGSLWTGYHLLFEWLELRASRFRRVRYESFVADPERSFADVARFLVPDAVDAPMAAAPVVHDISGNPLRFAAGPLAIRRDDEWITRLPARARRIVTVTTAPLLRRYGYDLRVPE